MSRQDRLNSEKCQLDILVPNLLSVDTKKSTESMTLKYLPYQSLTIASNGVYIPLESVVQLL